MIARGHRARSATASRLVGTLGLVLGLATVVSDARAQVRYPTEERPELPDLEPTGEAPRLVLPPLPTPADDDRRLSTLPALRVRGYRFVGNSAFDDSALAAVLAAYSDREISSADIPRIRDAITLHYVEAGYVNSGAVVPDQEVVDGVVEVRIVEGRLDRVEIAGNRHFRGSVLRRRIERGARVPLRVADLEREVRLLQEDPRIQGVDAELRPGSAPGRAVLQVRVAETTPYLVGLEASNRESPSLGGERGSLRLGHQNLLGFGDSLSAVGYLSEGLWEADLRYELPVTPSGTTFRWYAFLSDSEVVTDPFRRVDVESESRTHGFAVRQPLYHVPGTELSMALVGEWRRSETFLLGRPRSFEPGPDQGRSTVSVLRLRHDLLHRGASQVIALRSQLTGGFDILGATTNRGRRSVDDLGGEVPDGRFVSWLAQLQWARRHRWGIETLMRADLQLSNDPLLAMERLPVGGADSVRGYRENQIVRDQGFIGSIEVRIPLWRDATAGRYLQLAPFFDIGHAWNRDRDTPDPRTLPSLGVGLRAGLSRWIHGELYWGHGFRDVPDVGDDDLQDDGIHFRVTVSLSGPRSLWNDVRGASIGGSRRTVDLP